MLHTPIIKYCTFCKQESDYVPIPEMEKHNATVHFCKDCNVEYTYFPRGDMANTSIYFKINDRHFRWSMNSAGMARLWAIGKPGIPGVSKNENMKCIQTFNSNEMSVPEITPQNAVERIGAWLLFL